MSPICFGVNDILSKEIEKTEWVSMSEDWYHLSLGHILYVQVKYLVLCTSVFKLIILL